MPKLIFCICQCSLERDEFVLSPASQELGWFLLGSHHWSCSQPAVWLMGSAHGILFLKKVQQRDESIPGTSSGHHDTALMLTMKEGCAQVPPDGKQPRQAHSSFLRKTFTVQFLCTLMTILPSYSLLLCPRMLYALMAKTDHCNAGLSVFVLQIKGCGFDKTSAEQTTFSLISMLCPYLLNLF